jgi:hypothetical protein
MGAQTAASAAVKAGQSCSKAGATSTSKGIKYTCIKSGKKLVWNKGHPQVLNPQDQMLKQYHKQYQLKTFFPKKILI